MKKIIFVINNLETGGVQTSLINLLNEINKSYDVSVLFFYYKDEYKKKLPSNIKILTLKSHFKYFGVSQSELKNKKIEYIKRAIWVLLIRIFGRSNIIKLMCCFQKKLSYYDYAVSYLHESHQKNVYGGCNEFVLKKVVANKKITWLHCDFELCGANNSKSKKIYSQFDNIIACSKGCRDSFVRCFPNMLNKTEVIRNCNDYENIKQMSKNGVEYSKNFFNIVTVARLSPEKGIERAIYAVKYCVNKGLNVRYHIIGYGSQEEKLKALVEELKLTNEVKFYGCQSNPYIYITNADLFVLTSYHEAAPMVFDEAIFLGIPIFATKTTSTNEMVLENNYGFICENNQNSISNELFKVLMDKKMIIDIKSNLVNKKNDNNDSINKFKKIFN